MIHKKNFGFICMAKEIMNIRDGEKMEKNT
jgi:hypothetical protein